MKQVLFYDTTLRDGKQAEGVNFSLTDMIAIARRLDEFGIDYLECGWPGALPKDKEFFHEIQKYELKHSRLVAFGSTRHAANQVSEDNNIQELIAARTPVVTIFGKSWDLHVNDVFRIGLDVNLEMIYDSVAYIKDQGRELIYDAEHFFDGYKENPEYALRTLQAAERGGADSIALCDTNGGLLPHEIAAIYKAVRQTVKIPVGIHAHNDGEMGVANSLELIRLGGNHVQGTINGIGERCGNANLTSIIPNLLLKMDFQSPGIDRERLRLLQEVSHYVYEMANMMPSTKQPFVGMSAFAHKAGVHVNAVEKNPRTYEHIDPQLVGNHRRILISEQAGKSNILSKIQELGLQVPPERAKELLQMVKNMEHMGYEFEGADASFQVMVKRAMGEFRERFKIDSIQTFSYISGKRSQVVQATVKLKVGKVEEITVAEGDGPVNALDTALKKALAVFYPVVRDIRLIDYKVRILNPREGTAALTRVLIEFRYRGHEWGTVGVSGNVLEASWTALVDGMHYILNKLESDEI